jgi:acetolactate synthase-1/2/3 large subunit
VLFSNRTYPILEGELANVGENPGRRRSTCSISGGRTSTGWGARPRRAGARVTNMEEFNRRFADAVASPGPFLVEVVL